MKSLFSTLCATSQAKGVDQSSPFITSVDDSQPIIDKEMRGGDHQTLQEIGTKCGTSGVIIRNNITSSNLTTIIEATILTIYIAFEAILQLSQLPPKFDLSQIQPFNQLGGGVTCGQLDLLGYVPFQVFEFTTLVKCPSKNLT